MSVGGRRKGAGRKPGPSTRQIRVKSAVAGAARAITDYYLAKACRVWAEKYGQGFDVGIREVAMKETRSPMSERGESAVVLVCYAERDGFRNIFTIDLDTGTEGFHYENEEDL
jgi:hypothetical protein